MATTGEPEHAARRPGADVRAQQQPHRTCASSPPRVRGTACAHLFGNFCAAGRLWRVAGAAGLWLHSRPHRAPGAWPRAVLNLPYWCVRGELHSEPCGSRRCEMMARNAIARGAGSPRHGRRQARRGDGHTPSNTRPRVGSVWAWVCVCR
eukprot:6055181-Prymnesium_polylepis.1